MNTPKEQAELYRKAADTIEMCANHGIEPLVKWKAVPCGLYKLQLFADYCHFEFPIAVIEGELIWKDTVVYDCNGNATTGANMMEQYVTYSLKPKPLCMVEGKPVYKGDELWFKGGEYADPRYVKACNIERELICVADGGYIHPKKLSWSPKPKTIMVEMLEDDAKLWASFSVSYGHEGSTRLYEACRAALNKQQGT